MNQPLYGVNAFTVRDVELLLTVTSGGSAVHLARVTDPDSPGRAAVPGFYFDASNRRSAPLKAIYDQGALTEPRWSPMTLCGREWAVMAVGEGGVWDDYDDQVALSPTCRRCLSVMDKLFPAPRPDERLALVAQLVADAVGEHGHAELRGVPGDQQDAVRTAVRTLVRQRTSQSCRSYVHESMVLFVAESIYAEHAEDNMRDAAEAIEQAMSGGDPTPVREPEWRVFWDSWAVS